MEGFARTAAAGRYDRKTGSDCLLSTYRVLSVYPLFTPLSLYTSPFPAAKMRLNSTNLLPNEPFHSKTLVGLVLPT
jgi:hypothetical protein